MCKCCQLPVANVQLRTGKWNWLLATLAKLLVFAALSLPAALVDNLKVDFAPTAFMIIVR